jgi:hypothetical protein
MLLLLRCALYSDSLPQLCMIRHSYEIIVLRSEGMADRKDEAWIETDILCGALTWRPFPALCCCKSLQP